MTIAETVRQPGGTQHDGWRSQIGVFDLLHSSLLGLRARRARTAFTAAGIAIGIASMVAIVGISASSKAALLAQLDAFGTNVLEVRAASTGSDPPPLPVDAPSMLRRIPTVTDSASVMATGLKVRRNRFDSELVGIDAIAADDNLVNTLRATIASGRMIDEETGALPVVVLGSAAADRLGFESLRAGPIIRVGDHNVAVVGILDPLPLNPDIDRSVIIGDRYAIEQLRLRPRPSRVFVRIDPDRIDDTYPLLSPTANPIAPHRVELSRPSDLLRARAEIDQNLRNLLLTLGGVALVVGGLGIANIMVISVLERTGEIGLRRALGAHRSHIAGQFVLEAGMLSGLGGLIGVAAGVVITWLYAKRQDWLVDVPAGALLGGVAAALLIGMLAGLYPASKAARLDPADAVRSGTR